MLTDADGCADEGDNMNSDEEQHTSAYVSIRQHTPAYASIRQLDGADEGDNMNSDEEGWGRGINERASKESGRRGGRGQESRSEGGGINERASKESGRKGGRGQESRSEGGGCSDESNEPDDDSSGTEEGTFKSIGIAIKVEDWFLEVDDSWRASGAPAPFSKRDKKKRMLTYADGCADGAPLVRQHQKLSAASVFVLLYS
jgi:hypothetical protein